MNRDIARKRRKQATVSEGILWSLLRGAQVSGLKFRREHPIGPWIVDFACLAQKLVVEVDGAYHDQVVERDLERQEDLSARGWKVLRYAAEDVEANAEAVARAIAIEAGIEYVFNARQKTGAGKFNLRAKKPRAT